jgi:hypothetical protein
MDANKERWCWICILFEARSVGYNYKSMLFNQNTADDKSQSLTYHQEKS